jgi:hypothetical protein
LPHDRATQKDDAVTKHDDLKRAFGHVVWLGGATDSGKTSLAMLLAERHGLQTYHFDRHELAHFERAERARQPALWAAHTDRMGPEERWLGSAPDAMARATLACWMERASLALCDLRAMPAAPPIVAEGPGFFPDAIAPLMSDPRQAVWLLSSEAFKRASVSRRDKLRRVPLSDYPRAVENLIQRDLLMSAHIRQRAAALGLDVIDVDGSQPLAEVAALLETRFAPWLPDSRS